MIVVNTETIAGLAIVETKGLVQGNTVRAKNFGRDIAASFKNLVGGELKKYNEMMDVIADVTDVPLVNVFKSNIDELETAAKEVNKKLFNIVCRSYDGTPSTADGRAVYRRQIKSTFEPLDITQYRPTDEDTENIRIMLRKFITPPFLYRGQYVMHTMTLAHLKSFFMQQAQQIKQNIESRYKINGK